MARCVWTSKVRGFQSTRCVSEALFTALRVAAAGVRRCCEGELRALSSFLPRSPVRVYGVLGALPVDSAARRSACVHPVSCLGSERGGSRVYEWPPTSNAKLAFTAVVQLSLLPSSYVFSWVFASEALGGASCPTVGVSRGRTARRRGVSGTSTRAEPTGASSHVFICSPVSSPASGL